MIFMEMDLITRRQFIKKTGLATGALLFSGSLMSGKKYKKEKRPNVIFVFADQWRAQDTGFGGNKDVYTPNLDLLAKESLTFNNAVSCMPVSTPYRASLLTGQYAHIINGHIPVKTLKGEKPVKAGGKLLVIDGGFSKAYQPETGIAGYTLIFHSRGLQLVQHEPFESTQKAIEDGIDIISTNIILELSQRRMRVRDTDIGKELEEQIYNLNKLLVAYRNGYIKEKQ